MSGWKCLGCEWKNEPSRRVCAMCGKRRRKKRVPAHARTLRDDSYERYSEINAAIHGVTDESCGVCGKQRGQERRHDRDHGHLKGDLAYGKPRGLACVSCNRLMPRELDEDRARLVYLYLRRVRKFYELEEAA